MTPSLIERLGGASEGSRELDAALEIFFDIRPPYVKSAGEKSVIHGADGDILVYWQGVSGTLRATNWEPGHYTTSIDSALALVEAKLPGTAWRVGLDPGDGSMRAELVTAAPACVVSKANHDCAPLAICIALLRALPSQGE